MRSILTVALSALLCSSAFAADAVIYQESAPEPVAAPALSAPTAYEWSGFYAGVDLGHGWDKMELKVEGLGEGEGDLKGIFGGVYGGYNYEIDDWVLGAEGDVQFSGIKTKKAGTGSQIEMKWFGTARLRAGYAIDRFLPYLTGGVAVGKVSAKGVDKSKTHVGYVLGAGLDYAVTDNLIGKVEYQFQDLGKKTYEEGVEASLKAHTVRVGLAYKF